jgi:protocatechuate 3,4-dioxygenase beta subunit
MRPRSGESNSPHVSFVSTRLTRRGFLGAAAFGTAALAVAACRAPATVSPPTANAAASRTAASATPTTAPATPTSAPTALAAPTAAPPATDTAVPPTASTAAAPATVVSPTAVLTPTDSNVDAEDETPSETEGPYFKANSPERASLIDAGVTGTRLTISGRVLSTRVQPVAKALLDFWQANAQGSYDNAGYTLRGHQFSDAEGHYQLVSVVPGLYPGRTRHIHVKVQAPNHPVLTTQLYFPNEPRNSSDPLYNPKLLLPIQDAPDGSKVATFNFVLNVG